MPGRSLSWLVIAALVPMAAGAQDDQPPDLALLEYLGSWEGSDEEWLIVAEEFMGALAAASEDLPDAFDGAGEPADDGTDVAEAAADRAEHEEDEAGESDEN